ncbi:hypothetical protein V3O24_07190 [Methylobacter sp. Wu8]|uniref:Uncharacterized protein n=1 Tax=Methylobacter tundripaludum TaxID=173365 RepID=A0A2S6H277_9GAMM|nr:hypothetical protein [Methylobacter tundripaludum]MCF7964437.1 hypothetical protein [Methylobacter tundripaludum]MCK9637952.1 hypothetical protein [Methylobacter tundripaludum]PPK71541.1 hypothetical protein B0F88_10765 [Methylobacter tundripaludum]
MLHLARFAGIAVLVWFYLSAKEKGESPLNWAIIGLIGYWITWWVIKLTVVSALSGMVAKNPMGTFLLYQIPALCAIGAAFLIRKKLLADAAEKD